jgi:hypothetical protein
MAFRLADRVARGEIFNTRYYSTHGWLELRDSDQPVLLQLTGNCSPDLAGWHFRFEVENPLKTGAEVRTDSQPEPHVRDSLSSNAGDASACSTDSLKEEPLPPESTPSDDPSAEIPMDSADPSGLAWQQIGPTGTMTADRQVRVFDCSVEEYYRRCQLGDPPPTEWKRCLYLEWFSQNGRVVLELPGAVLDFAEFVAWPEGQNSCQKKRDDHDGDGDSHNASPETAEAGNTAQTSEELPPPDSGLNITEICMNADGAAEITEQFFPPAEEDSASEEDDFDDESAVKDDDPYQLFPDSLQKQLDTEAYHTDWKIQGESDDGEKSETIRELELMDYLIENSDGDEFDSFCHIPIPLERIECVSDERAEAALKDVLGQLALCGVALDFCRHYTPRRAYRLLLEEIFPEERFFPQLRGTGWVQHFSTYEFCPECDAEFEKEYNEGK